MKRAARWIVRHRLPLTAVLLALSAVCGLLSFQVPINADMTKYLPADSAMKQGMDVMEREFGSLSLPPTLRVMIENLPAEEDAGALEKLRAFPAAASAVLSGRKREEGTSYTLFTVTLSAPYRTPEALETEHGIPGAFPDRRTTVRNDDANGMDIPLFIYAVAGAMLLAVLFTFCASWAEPFVFLAVLGAAILMNMGTNLLLGSVSVTTHSISAILQLVLSMDYSIILINRFRREYGTERDAEEAMARALAGAFPSIASSGMTTVVGLLMLVFMRFRIGADLGLVLAKGVFLSMVCCLTLLPAGILFARRAIERTKKPSIHIPTRALAGFGFRGRRAVAGGFVLLFFGGWYLSGLSGISYSLNQEDPIAEIFPKENQIVLLYGNRDEAAAGSIAQALEKQDGAWRVTGVFLSQSGANYDDYHTGWDWESPSVYWFGDHYLVGASGGSVNVYDIATGHLHELCGSDFRTFYRLESAGADFVKVVRASWRKPAAEGTAPDSLWEITISSKPDGILDAVCDEKAKGNRGVNLGKKKPARKAELPAGGTSVSKAGNPPAQETSGDGKKPAQPASAESRDKNPDALPSGAEGIKAVTESPAPGEKAAPADSAKAAGGAENNDSQKESSN